MMRTSSLLAEAPSSYLTAPPPKFRRNQQVYFLGGQGKIKTYQSDLGTWTYMIEMELGPEPDVGRVGPETTILLQETDIWA